jgi:uncharacterized protein (DUF1778 family)
MPATARVTARVSESVREFIEEAAALRGTTVNQFLVQSAYEKAQQVIEEERLVRLSVQDARAFFEALENPPAPNDALKQAARRHAELLGRASG